MRTIRDNSLISVTMGAFLALAASILPVHAQTAGDPFWTGNDHVFGICRQQAGESLLVVANFTADPQAMSLDVARSRGFELTGSAVEPDGRSLESYHDFVVLAPYQHLWFYA